MRKLFVICLGLLVFIFGQDVFAQNARPALTTADYEEMIDNYDGKFRNHTKTDGIQIDPKKLAEILSRYEGQDVALLYARHLKKTGLVNGKKKRVTLLLRIKKPLRGAGDALAIQEFEYIDLSLEFLLCPPPEDCSGDQ